MSIIRQPESRYAYAILFTTVVLWGGGMVVGKFVGEHLPPMTIGGLRAVLASLILAFFLVTQKGLALPERRDWPMLLTLGMLGVFGATGVYHLALQHTTATNTGLISAGGPVVITLFSAAFLKERISSRQIIAIIISVTGVIVVITKGSWMVLAGLDLNIGDVIMLGNPFLFAAYAISTKKLVDRYSPLLLAFYGNLVGAVFFLPFGVYEIAAARSDLHVSGADLGALAYMGLIASSLAVILWNKGVKKVGASRAGIFINGVPITSMLLSAIALGEEIAPSQIFGAAMVITGVYLNSVHSTASNEIPANAEKEC